jgi:ribonuclease P protein component
MTGSKIYSLGKLERLKSRKLIDGLFDHGNKMIVFPFRIMYQLSPGEPGLKAGFTVSSRNFPRAADRNRIKRLSREAYRLQKNTLQEMLKETRQEANLFFIYTGKEIPDLTQVRNSIQLLIDKLVKQLHEGNSSNN